MQWPERVTNNLKAFMTSDLPCEETRNLARTVISTVAQATQDRPGISVGIKQHTVDPTTSMTVVLLSDGRSQLSLTASVVRHGPHNFTGSLSATTRTGLCTAVEDYTIAMMSTIETNTISPQVLTGLSDLVLRWVNMAAEQRVTLASA